MGINQGTEKNGKSKQKKTNKPAPLKKEKGIIPSDYACALQSLEEQDVPENEVRIILLGVDGAGKSSVGNVITGARAEETASRGFRASTYSTCVRNGRRFVVVDSPCLFHTRIAPKFVITEVNKLIGLTCPGPHICIFVVPNVELSSEDKQTMSRIQNAFLPGAADNSLVVLTKSDLLSSRDAMEDYTSNAAAVVRNIIKTCNNRVVQINKVTDDEENGAQKLFDMIELILDKNRHTYYTNEVYKLVQVNLRVHKNKSKEKYMKSDKGVTLLEQTKQVEKIRSRESAEEGETNAMCSSESVEEGETNAMCSRESAEEGESNAMCSQETLEPLEAELKRLTENMMEVVCDQVRDDILQQSITPFELNLRRLITSGTKAIGSFLTSFMWFLP